MTRQAYHHEIRASSTVPFAMALLEGGVIAVVARNVFGVGNLAFATIVAAPMFANLTSVLWARVAMGKPKVRVTSRLLFVALMLVALIAVLPTSGPGPALLVAVVVSARIFIAGVVNVRSTIWRMNYPRNRRARITTRFALVSTMILMAVPLAVGPLLDWQPWTFRVVFPVMAAIGVLGVVSFSRVRVRGERKLLADELRPESSDTPRQASGAPHTAWSVLCQDGVYRWYMGCQFLGGTANMMAITAFTLMAIDHLQVVSPGTQNTQGMLLSAAVPLLVATASMSWWSRRLDRLHIAQYRILHAMTWVANQSIMFFAAWFASLPLMYLAAAGWGVMQGGGMLAWQLGHNDFADKRLVPMYMSIHQTLTGVRGAFAPFLGTALFAGWPALERFGVPAFAGIGPWLFAATASISLVSWVGFVLLLRRLRASGGGLAKDA